MNYNLLNEAMNLKKSVTPIPGMMGTLFVGSDRYKVVCLATPTPKSVLVACHGDFTEKEVDGIHFYDGNLDDLINYYVPTIDDIKTEYGQVTEWTEEDFKKKLKERKDDMTYTLRKNCRWIQKGCSEWGAGAIHWGHAEEYLDPSY